MLLIELCPDSNLEEASIKSKLGGALAAGALGAGLIAGNYNKTNIPEPPSSQAYLSPETSPQASGKLDQVPTIYANTKTDTKVASVPKIDKPVDVHNNFPEELFKQKTVEPKERISKFISHFLPYIDSANEKVRNDRQTLFSILEQGTNLDEESQRWIDLQAQKYNAKSIKELILKMDEIPRSMALAQAAIESGWGTSDLARKGNAFYGQISGDVKKSARANDGQRFGTFDHPRESVESYVQNLNSHPAYSSFRQHRFQLRKNGKKLDGNELMGNLHRYSTRGEDYIREIRSLINSQYFKNLDKTQDQ